MRSDEFEPTILFAIYNWNYITPLERILNETADLCASHWLLASLTEPLRCLLCVRSMASAMSLVTLCAFPTLPVRAQTKFFVLGKV